MKGSVEGSFVIRRNWLTTPKEDVKKGPPLTCLLCKGVLILNAEGLQMHLASKRHKKQQSRLENSQEDTIMYAEDLQEDSSGDLPYPLPLHAPNGAVMLHTHVQPQLMGQTSSWL